MMGTSDGTPVCVEPSTFAPGPPADALFDHEVARVEVGLRADPDAIPDPAGAIHAPLNHSLFTEKHAAPDLERFGMAEDDAAADRHAVADGSCERAQHDAPHQRVEFRLAMHEAAIELHQSAGVVARPQMLAEPALEGGVRLNLASAVHRRHRACRPIVTATSGGVCSGGHSRKRLPRLATARAPGRQILHHLVDLQIDRKTRQRCALLVAPDDAFAVEQLDHFDLPRPHRGFDCRRPQNSRRDDF